MADRHHQDVVKALYICNSCNNFGLSDWDEDNAECASCGNTDVEWMELSDQGPYGALARKIEIQMLELIRDVQIMVDKIMAGTFDDPRQERECETGEE